MYHCRCTHALVLLLSRLFLYKYKALQKNLSASIFTWVLTHSTDSQLYLGQDFDWTTPTRDCCSHRSSDSFCGRSLAGLWTSICVSGFFFPSSHLEIMVNWKGHWKSQQPCWSFSVFLTSYSCNLFESSSEVSSWPPCSASSWWWSLGKPSQTYCF